MNSEYSENNLDTKIAILIVIIIMLITQHNLPESNPLLVPFVVLLVSSLIFFYTFLISASISIVLQYYWGKEAYNRKIEKFNSKFIVKIIGKTLPLLIIQSSLTIPVTILAYIIADLLSMEHLVKNYLYLPIIYTIFAFSSSLIKTKKTMSYLLIIGFASSIIMAFIQSKFNLPEILFALPLIIPLCIYWSYMFQQIFREKQH